MVTFRGSYSVTVTPFTPDGSAVDLEALERFIEWQVESGVPGVIVLGTTGEFLTVSDEERTAIVETAVRQAGGRAHVLVGTMNAHTPTAVRYSREAQALGADGLMVLPPYYYTPTEDEIWGYYRAVSEAVSIPIMLYNNPVTSNVDMPAALVGRLTRDFENVRYIKEASMDVARVRDVVEATDGVMNVFAGERQVDSYLLGAVGYVNPYGNYIVQSHRVWDLLVADRIDDARALARLIDEIDHIIAAGHPTYGHQCYSKALAAAAGYAVGDVRPPLTTFAELGDEGRERVQRILPLIAEFDRVVDRLGLTARPAAQAATAP
jgi:4-hydroxy-tetrahydrodipicolinate synthase